MIIPVIIQTPILPFVTSSQTHALHFHVGRSCSLWPGSRDFHQDSLVCIPFYSEDILKLLSSLHHQLACG